MRIRLVIAPILVLLAFHGLVAKTQNAKTERLTKLLAMSPAIHRLDRDGRGRAVFLSYRDSNLSSATFGVELCVLEVQRGFGRLHVKDLRVSKVPSEVFASAFAHGTIGAINGGFFGLDARGKPIPLGLVKTAGRTVARRHPWASGGMVAASDVGVDIVPVARFQNTDTYSEVIQSKPLLVEHGADGIRSDSGGRFDRSAVALDSRGNLYFFVVHEPSGSAATISEFSQLLLMYRSALDNVAIDTALAMDGGPGAHMYVPALGRHCGSGAPTFVPNAIFID